MSKQTPAQKAFAILKKNLNALDMKELIGLLEYEVEKQVQEEMMEQVNDQQ